MRKHGFLAKRRHRQAEIMAQRLISWSVMQARDKRAQQERQAERERTWKETIAAVEREARAAHPYQEQYEAAKRAGIRMYQSGQVQR